jgi:hypothetical protein
MSRKEKLTSNRVEHDNFVGWWMGAIFSLIYSFSSKRYPREISNFALNKTNPRYDLKKYPQEIRQTTLTGIFFSSAPTHCCLLGANEKVFLCQLTSRREERKCTLMLKFLIKIPQPRETAHTLKRE